MKSMEMRWNIFARELQDIMQAHGNALGVIDDRTAIHREKVRRLQKSLLTPKRFPLLSPNDLDMLIQEFELSPDEVIRLRAAVLATSVEATLMGRISQHDALRAAEQVFEITLDSLRIEDNAFQSVRHGGEYTSQASPDSDGDASVPESALAAIDWAMLSIHLAMQSNSSLQRLTYLRQARETFDFALEELDVAEDATAADVWREEANQGLTIVTTELDDLGD
jgi:hypothetical protein